MPAERSRNIGAIIWATFREPVFGLLTGAALLYLAIGDLGEGLFVLAGALTSVALVVFQEARSERALAALRELSEPYARVIRNGRTLQVKSREIAPGDALIVMEGERIAADAVLAEGDALSVDESALTGESAPVVKVSAAPEDFGQAPEPGADRSPFLFAGCLVLRGQGVAIVSQTGPRTRLGAIGASLFAIESEPTALQKTIGSVIGRLGLLALTFCALVTLAQGYLSGDWIAAGLSGITLAVALLPEEFPMVIAIFMAIGAWRMAARNVLVRRGAVIETLGATTLLCVDKTGTLTQNRMAVRVLWRENATADLDGGGELDASSFELVDVARRASALHPVDPMDAAIAALAGRLDFTALEAPARIFPLRPELLAYTQAWASSQTAAACDCFAKGAPEAIFQLCRIGADRRARLDAQMQSLAARGLRVLGVARALGAQEPGETLASIEFEFIGLVGFEDPVRADVPAALAAARAAGVDVAMITGDYPATAMEIARRAGVSVEAGVLSGTEIAALDDAALASRLRDVRVFARVTPEQKLRLVRAFKTLGHIVAMTGDGVNDAPALEASHVGIAMGKRGTDVAREASDLVLLDDRFASIVAGIALGRRIFANLRRALIYVTAIHIPIAGLALAPLLVGLPPLLMPMHLVLLELIVDPVTSVIFESAGKDVDAMRQPPRVASESLFGWRELANGLLYGGVILAVVFGLYWWAATHGFVEPEARAIAFVALVVANVTLAFAQSADSIGDLFGPQKSIYLAIAALTAAILTLVLAVPALRAIFHLAMPDATALAIAITAALAAGVSVRLLRPSRS